MKQDAYKRLQDVLGLRQALPVTPDWSAAADFLDLLVQFCLAHHPARVFECSSGLSTLVLARCCQLNSRGHVTSLEHERQYQEQTCSQLKAFGLEDYATVLHAPLVEQVFSGDTCQWYDVTTFSERMQSEADVDLLVIDGPPGYIQALSRYPALPVLYQWLAAGARVYLDDAARDDERLVVERWLRQYPQLEHDFIDNERGCSLLYRRG